MSAILAARGVGKSFGSVEVLRDISIAVMREGLAAGEVAGGEIGEAPGVADDREARLSADDRRRYAGDSFNGQR